MRISVPTSVSASHVHRSSAISKIAYSYIPTCILMLLRVYPDCAAASRRYRYCGTVPSRLTVDTVVLYSFRPCKEALGDFILHHTKPTNPRRQSHQRNNRKQAGWQRGGTVITMTVLAMQANATIATERKTQFDTDSETIGIDNRCSGCI